MLRLAKLTQKNFRKVAKSTGKAQLLTIPFSHFAEFARWSLEHAGVAFHERQYAPVQHVLPVLNLRVGGKEKFTTSGSTSTKKYSKGGNPTAVPALVLPDGSVLADSWDIALNCFKDDSLGPDDERRRFLDSELGPDTRQLCYAWLLKPSNATIWNELITSPRFGTFWKYLWSYFGLGSRVTKTMSKVFHATDEAATKEVSDRVDQHFAKMSSRLKQRQGRYLNGDELSVEDIAFCSLAAPVVLPPEYCRGWFQKEFDAVIAQDNEIKEKIEELRATEAGQYVLEVYREHRLGSRSTQAAL